MSGTIIRRTASFAFAFASLTAINARVYSFIMKDGADSELKARENRATRKSKLPYPKEKKWRWLSAVGALVLVVSGTSACLLYRLERSLDPVNAAFLSKTRYVITREERKIFLEMPDSAKPEFIDEFWKRRDPDPDTEENEFKIEYFRRIDEADKTFLGEGIPGWLTDRGRILILFGFPTDRITQPMSSDSNGRCREIWYYGNFPVVFDDRTCTENFKLVTYDLTELRDLNLLYMQELNKAQAAAQLTYRTDKKMFDFRARIDVKTRGSDRLEAVIVVEIVHDRIWYKSEGKTFFATLDVAAELLDERKAIIWNSKKTFDLRFDESEIGSKAGTAYAMEIPMVVQGKEALGRLSPGHNIILITVTNATGTERLIKSLAFR